MSRSRSCEMTWKSGAGMTPNATFETVCGAGEMAEILGVSRRHLRRLVEAGDLPRPTRDGARPEFEIGPTVRAFLSRLTDRRAPSPEITTQASADLALTIARTRKTETEAAALARRLAGLESTLLDRGEVAAAWREVCAVIRGRIREIAAEVAGRLASAGSLAERERILAEAVRAALLELSSANIEFEPPESDPQS